MAHEPSSSSSQSQTLETLDQQPQPSLTRSLSKLNAKAPEFVPRVPAVISPPPPPPPQNIIHLFNPIHHHPHPHPHHQHVAAMQFHHHQNAVVHKQNHNHHHQQQQQQRVFNGGGGGGGGGGTGFVEPNVAVLAKEKDVEVVVKDESTQKIINQVEYYFSDINLATTDHLMRFISKDPEGYVPISVVVSFKKIKALVSGHAQLATILRNSGKLVVSEDGKKVKRQHPLTEADMEELQSRIIVAENLPEDHCHQNLMKIFSAVGSVKTIRTCQPQASNGGATSASRGASKADAMHFSNKLHAFVEYETIELAEKAALELNKEGNWRNSLKVRLLRRPAKPAQARGKKAGQEDEAVHKEDDTSTSEQHSPNEKHLDDTHQQSEVQSHEHVQGEDHSNEKEGGQKKGRNRGRGKGRGRPQYNHHNNHYNNHNNHNNRGAHVVTPPSSNSVNNEHPVIGKQPPGPRMPDGTRGFSMGRGKPISVAIETSIS